LSRIGKVPVIVPSGVQVTISEKKIEVKGTKGTLSRDIPEEIKVEHKDAQIFVTPAMETENVKAFWGLYRMLIENMVIGVSKGYRKELEIHGVGYKAELKGKDLNVSAGYSSPKLFKVQAGLVYSVENQTKIIIEGIDKQAVGQAAADVRRIRPPEPYKGKGIRYVGEQIRRKEGKAAGK
jgi:large subunit ribosomal protein L6